MILIRFLFHFVVKKKKTLSAFGSCFWFAECCIFLSAKWYDIRIHITFVTWILFVYFNFAQQLGDSFRIDIFGTCEIPFEHQRCCKSWKINQKCHDFVSHHKKFPTEDAAIKFGIKKARNIEIFGIFSTACTATATTTT